MGCASAMFLAERGASVTVLEREQIAGAASGRNAGSIQHPLHADAAALYAESVEIYRRFALISPHPQGMLAVTVTESAARAAHALAAPFPELHPELLQGAALKALEPGLADGLFGCRLATAYPAHPGDATRRFAELARERGVSFVEGADARPVVHADRVVGAETDDSRYAADVVLVAAGPWSAGLLPGPAVPIKPVWGVTVQIAMHDPPRHRLEEWGEDGDSEGTHFEATPLESVTILGATRTAHEPDQQAFAHKVLSMAERFIPAVGSAQVVATRVCARPVSADLWPLLGPVAGVDGLFIASGHGSLGISLAPGSARLVADAIVHGQAIPQAWSPERWRTKGDPVPA